MSNDNPFLDLLEQAPGAHASATAHLLYAGKMLAEANRQMADMIRRKSGSANPPHAYAIANAHTALANTKTVYGAL